MPTYRPTTTARPMGHSVRFMACPVGLPLPLFTGQPHTFSLPRLVIPIYRKVSRLAQLEPKGAKVTLLIRTCHGKKGLFTPCSFSCPNRKCPKTHEKSLVHVIANSQDVTTKRTPFRGGGGRGKLVLQIFFLYILSTSLPSTPASQVILSLITPPNHISTLHK